MEQHRYLLSSSKGQLLGVGRVWRFMNVFPRSCCKLVVSSHIWLASCCPEVVVVYLLLALQKWDDVWLVGLSFWASVFAFVMCAVVAAKDF